MRIFFKNINLLSIDVAIGAMVCTSFISHLIGVNPSLLVIITLGLTVWAIYTFDHLIDSNKKDGICTDRHIFHLKYYVRLSKLLIIALLIIGTLIFYLPARTLFFGAVLSCSVMIYFLSIHLLNWKHVIHKELVISIIYSLGVFLAPISLYEGNFTFNQLLIGLIFFLIVLLNVLIFSLFDYHADKRAKFPSLVLNLGIRKARLIIQVISFFTIFFIAFLLINGSDNIGILFFVMFLILQVLFWFKAKPFIISSYRFIGDGIFLLPLLHFL